MGVVWAGQGLKVNLGGGVHETNYRNNSGVGLVSNVNENAK